MRSYGGAIPGGLGLVVLASVLALLALPGGNLTSDGSSYSVSRHGYRLGVELLQELGYDARPYPHGVETLPDGVALWVLEPGPSLLDEGPAGMGAVRGWVEDGNSLLLAFGGERGDLSARVAGIVDDGEPDAAARDDSEELRDRVLRGIEERQQAVEGDQTQGGDRGTGDPTPAEGGPETTLRGIR